MRLRRRLRTLFSDLGEGATFLAYGLWQATTALIHLTLFALACTGLVLTAFGTALLWVVTAAGGVRLEPVVVRWPLPAPSPDTRFATGRPAGPPA